MGADIIAEGVDILRQNTYPLLPDSRSAPPNAMREMVTYSRYRARPLRVIERFAVNKFPVMKIFKSAMTAEVIRDRRERREDDP